MLRLSEAIDRYGVDVHPHLDRQVMIPVIDGLQCQGDVAVIPAPRPGQQATAEVPPVGVPVVRGEAGGHTHLLLAQGPVFFDPRPVSARGLVLGVLTVPPGSVAYLAHPEHAYAGIAPGTYELRRQREMAGQTIRRVAD
jgi:hypothetical protein